jgi:hypothetical protein
VRAAAEPTWTDVKLRLASLDRKGLLRLVQDLYAAHKDNRTFLHARFGLGEDVLKPYKQTIDRWMWPDVLRRQDTSVVKAKQAIASYKKAVGEPAGVAELMVFYCERAAGFCDDILNEDENYFAALVRMFEQAFKIANTLPAGSGEALIARLDRVRNIGQRLGYGVGDDMNFVFAKYTRRKS